MAATRVSRGGGLAVVCWFLVLDLAAVRVTSGALLRYASEFDLQAPPSGAVALEDDDLELNEFRLFDTARQQGTEFDEFDADIPFFRTDYDLSQFSPISATPAFTFDHSYIRPDSVLLARAKRANRLRGSKLRKRAPETQLETDRDADDDEDEHNEEEEEEEGKDNSEEVGQDVEDYATRYEQFIAKHFDDVEAKRNRPVVAAKQRKAGGKGASKSKKPTASGKGDTGDEEDGDYKFDRFDYSSSDDYERIKAESEEQSKRLSADPRNCRTYEKDGMVCSVCHDPASDSASESCAYATEPHHRKYAFVKERSYDSKKDGPERSKQPVEHDDDEEDDRADDDAADDDGDGSVDRPERQTTAPEASTTSLPRKPLPRPILRSNPHQLANGGGYRYQPSIVIKDMRSNRAPISMKLREKGAAQPEKKATVMATDDSDIYVMDYGEQDEVAKVLSDFATRDWSNCRKSKRSKDGEMTCYQCKDATGVNHEECMYVSESRQIASRLLFPPPPSAPSASASSPTTIDRKRRKVVAVKKENMSQLPMPATEGHGPAREKQTVKRTVSFRSFVTGSAASGGFDGASGEDSPSERVIHYEHHISHEVP
ncbi:uncharacterized protein DDB_G0286299-like [Anopheles aquasalis]|uniref:uncharacterized protein DDB_G0286299-like n=1 Tax=Anopheles aquasalis TaxID=42839 RepID=UPI00215A8AB2|nr:uncharacterized protein DDB_G0286299-like [Anopheles aquasalis]